MAAKHAGGLIEGSFVECLFEMWKLRNRVMKAQAEILATGMLTEYSHRFSDFIN